MTLVSIAHLRQLIRTLSYVVSTHAADELDDDNLSILDLENVVLTGQITERQRDRITRETKYVIQGSAWPKSNKCDTNQRVRGIMRGRRISIQGIEVIVRLL